MVIKPNFTKRQQKWMESVNQSLTKLQVEKKIKIEVLKDDDEFVSILIEATQIAMKNHQIEKLNALKNIIKIL